MVLRRALRNVVSNYASVSVTGLVGLILTPLLFHFLHPINYAVLAFAISLEMLLETVDLGLSSALIRFVSALAARGLFDDLRRLSSSIFFTLAVLGIAMAGLACLISGLAATFFHVHDSGGVHGDLVIALVSLSLLFQLPGAALRGYLRGCEDFHLDNAVEITTQILRAVATIALLETGYGLVAVAAIFPSISLFRLLALAVISRHGSIPFRPRVAEFSLASLKKIRGFAALCFVEDVVTPLFSQSDTFLTAKFLSLPLLAILSVARRIPSVVQRLAEASLTVGYPMVSSAAAREDRQALRKFALLSARNTLALTVPFCTALYVWAEPILRIWVGPEVLSGVSVFRTLLAFAIFASLKESPLAMLYGMGRIGFSAALYLGMLVGVVLLGPIVCLKGSLIGFVLLYAGIQGLGTILLIGRTLRIASVPAGWWAKKTFFPVIISEVPALVWLVFSFHALPHSLVGLIVGCVVALGIFLIVYTLVLTGTSPQTWQERMKTLLAGID